MADANSTIFASGEGEAAVAAEVKVYDSFDDMGLPENLLRGVYSNGFERPSPIQQRGIVPMLEGRDVLAQAQSGTGKTGTFVTGSLSRVDPTLKHVQVLVIVPVRELAHQIESVARSISSYMNINVYSATGGTPLTNDIKAIERGAQFIVGTPGRIYDLLYKNIIQRNQIRVLIMDEADQMLEDRFKDQMMCILNLGFPKTLQVALFSATMPEEVVEVANELLQRPARILIPPAAVPLEGIEQYFVDIPREEWKLDTLSDLYQSLNIAQALIFCNKRQRAEWIADKMSQNGFPISYIHGEMEVGERKRRMDAFRTGAVRILICTDLLARGIDIQQISLVINFELPTNKENYIHRIGRAGRFGRKGTTINLVSPDEMSMLKDIEKHYTIKINTLPDDLSTLTI